MRTPSPYIQISIDPAASLTETERRQLAGELNSISICYMLLLENVNLPKVKRINIEFTNGPYAQFGVIGPMRSSPVIAITSAFDFYDEIKFEQNSLIKRRKILQAVHENFIKICKHFNYDLSPFESVYTKLQSNLNDITLVLDNAISKDKKFKACMQAKIEFREVSLSIVIDQNSEIVNQISVVNIFPSYYFLDRVVGKLSWTGNSKLTLKAPGLGVILGASIHDNKMSIVESTPEKAKEYAEIELRLMTPEIGDDERAALMKKKGDFIS
ncbi:MAG TPA: hypothetical protein VIM75_07825 [Ohtaekwangia sp.]|uniref:hypothetical protein n=1 Tax=Ohtaekwangia sp. TaxID=2066019 RepID=UPI002F93A5B4